MGRQEPYRFQKIRVHTQACTLYILSRTRSTAKSGFILYHWGINQVFMNWILLIIAGLFEVGFTTCLGKAKNTTGTASTLWICGFFISLSLSMYLLYKATQTLPLGTAYAVWTGIGAVGTAIISVIFFKEPADFWRLFFIVTLIASIAGLKFVSSH